MIDTTTELWARVERRLLDEAGIWLVTVGADGTPQPNPVWFVWDGQELVFYSQPGKAKLRHIERRPRVALHLEGGPLSEDVAVLTGDARLAPDEPPVDQAPAYLAKYEAHIGRLGATPRSFAQDYSVAVRVRPTGLRGW